VPTFVTGRNLVGDVANTSARRDQSTVVIVRGGELAGLNTGIGLSRWPVTAISGAGPYVVTLADLVAGGQGPIGVDDQYNGQAILREADGVLQAISDCSAAAQTVTLAAIGDLAAGDVIQFRTTDDPATATPLVELAHPARVALYGRKIGTFKRESVIGVPNLVPNALVRTWTTPTDLPDGYTWSVRDDGLATDPAAGSAFTFSKNTDERFWKLGGQSLQFSATQGRLITPPFRWMPTYTGQRFSLRQKFYFTQFDNSNSVMFVTLGIRLADGTVKQWNEQARMLQIMPVSGTRQGPWEKVGTNVFVDLELKGSDVTAPSSNVFGYTPTAADLAALATSGALGFVAVIYFGGASERIEGYYDATMINPGPATPDGITEFGGSNVLHQTGNLVLKEVSAPAVEITSSVLDLERYNSSAFSAELLSKGAIARLIDPQVSPDDSLLRMIQIERDRLTPKNTRVTFSSRRRLFTDLLLQSGGGVLLGTGSGAGTSTTRASGNPTVTGSGGSSAPSITLAGSIASDVPSVAATVSPGTVSVKIAGSTTGYPDATAVEAETAITSFPASKTFSAISVGDSEYVSAFGYDLNGVRSAMAQTKIDDVFVDPGVQTNMALDFCDSMGDAGIIQSSTGNNRWDFVNRPSNIIQRATSGYLGGSCWEEGDAGGGFNDQYWQYTTDRSPDPHPNDLHVTGRLDLNAQSKSYEVPLLQAYPTLCALTMDATRHLKIYIDNGSGGATLLGTSTSALASSGLAIIEFRAHSHASAGYVWCRVNGALVEFAPFGGGANVRAFTGLAFTNTGFSVPGQLTSSIAFGTGSGFDFPWYPGTAYDAAAGIIGVRWDDAAVWNNSGSSTYDYVGNVTFCASFVTTAGLSSDDGDTSKDELTAVAETRSYAIGAIPSGATDIVAVVPFMYDRWFRPSGFPSTTQAYRWRVTSSASSVTRYRRVNGSYSAFLPGDLYSTNTYTGPNQTEEARWSVAVDPATSAAWLRAAVNALTLDLSVDALDVAGSTTIRISQMGVEVGYRP
jgi:hypothetical protein